MARAPGRLDVMGGIADYSGSLVLQVCDALCCSVLFCAALCHHAILWGWLPAWHACLSVVLC